MLGASGAQAVSVATGLFSLGVVGGNTWTNDGSSLGCTDTGNGTFSCSGANLVRSGLSTTITDWNLSLDSDPVVNASLSITNNALVVQSYVVTVVLPIAPAITGSSLLGGSIQGGVTDNNGDGATLSSLTGIAIYTPLIDGSPYAGGLLYPDVTSLTVGAYLSNSLAPASFGTPIPSQPGPSIANSIGIRLEFSLTPGDTATFSSVFVAAVPEPTTALLLLGACGAFGLEVRRRRVRA